jgi:prevent-host-death family protein
MSHRVIPQRELRNDVAAILRAAEAGETFTITVRGRPVARLGPPVEPGQPRVDVDRATIARILGTRIDDRLARDLDDAEAALDDPWTAG